MSDPGGFLSRWSRRKRGEQRPDESPADRTADAAPDPRLAPASADPAPAEMSLEDIAALPGIEDLTSETDLTQFLQAGVPAVLRRAALRRMWSLDPAIRDFVGEARDYSWDWNTEGGVPTFGPLLPTDDVQATLRGMFSRLAADPDSGVPEASEAPRGEPPEEELERVSTEPDPSAAAGASTIAEPMRSVPVLQTEPAASQAHAVRLSRDDDPSAAILVAERGLASALPPRRRHGAARPKLD